MYGTDRYCPVCPNSAFLHRTGVTCRTPDVDCSGAPTTTDGTTVAAGIVVIVSTELGAGTVSGAAGIGAPATTDEPHGAIVVEAHD